MLYQPFTRRPENGTEPNIREDKGKKPPHVDLPPKTGAPPKPVSTGTVGVPDRQKGQTKAYSQKTTKPLPAIDKRPAARDKKVSMGANPQRYLPVQDVYIVPDARALELPAALQPDNGPLAPY
jgi:hypothetical protein